MIYVAATRRNVARLDVGFPTTVHDWLEWCIFVVSANFEFFFLLCQWYKKDFDVFLWRQNDSTLYAFYKVLKRLFVPVKIWQVYIVQSRPKHFEYRYCGLMKFLWLAKENGKFCKFEWVLLNLTKIISKDHVHWVCKSMDDGEECLKNSRNDFPEMIYL